MNAECIGGSAKKLVDARFVRLLDDRERSALETHLAACGFCGERYRRLQLAERVVAVGAERAFEEPSPLEIDRIAADRWLAGHAARNAGPFSLNIGGMTLSPDWNALSALARVGGRIVGNVGLEALKLKLASMGILD